MKRTLILVALLLRGLLLSAHEDKLTEGYWQIAGNHGLAVSFRFLTKQERSPAL